MRFTFGSQCVKNRAVGAKLVSIVPSTTVLPNSNANPSKPGTTRCTMNPYNLRSPTSIRWFPALLSSLSFVLICLAFIPQVGVQNDEALFGSAIYQPAGIIHSIDVSGKRIPLMLISYLGALKTLLYIPLFARWKPSAASIRVPVIVAGAFTIWMFGLLLRRLSDQRAAVVGVVLLATDTAFLLTTCFDWGPVALHHSLMVAGVFCLLCFHQERKTRYLALAFFLFGLGIWDKALFLWMLGGLGIATLIVLPKLLWRHFTFKNLLIAVLAFAAGAAPLIRYNVREPWATFRGNASWSTGGIA